MTLYRPENNLVLKNKLSGFSLVELMVALLIGLLITLAAFQFFTTGQKNYKQAQALMGRQESLRFLVDSITYDIRSASSIEIGSDSNALTLTHFDKYNSICSDGVKNYAVEYSSNNVDNSIVLSYDCNILGAVDGGSGVDSIVFGFGDISFSYIQPSNIGVKISITVVDGNAEKLLPDEKYVMHVASRSNIGGAIGRYYDFTGTEDL